MSNFTVFFNSGRSSLVPVALSCLEKKDGVFKDHIHSSGDSKHFFIESHTKDFGNWKDFGESEIWRFDNQSRGQDARRRISAENLTVYARTIIIPGVQAKDMIEKRFEYFI